jgi:ornithine cyclodeaminase/alanine dehydrogenase-like protein (mu-crystallin family)
MEANRMTNAPGPCFYAEQDVADLVSLNDAIEALEVGLGREGRGEAINVAKALATFNQTASLHALGSVFPREGIGGFKTWTNTGERGVALMAVFDVAEGRLSALIEASVLGQLRTAAISGLATRWMSVADADHLALIGTGRQAMLQVAAVAAVRKLRRLTVFSPNAERRSTFVARARAAFPFAVDETESVEAAVAGAPMVTLVTRARSPFIAADMLAPGAHVNAVGAILPQNAEFQQDLFDRASMIVVDSVDGVRANSREFVDRFGTERDFWSRVRTLSSVIADKTARPANAQLTLFKAMGMGISDLSVAEMVLDRGRKQGIGLRLPAPNRASAGWKVLA